MPALYSKDFECQEFLTVKEKSSIKPIIKILLGYNKILNIVLYLGVNFMSKQIYDLCQCGLKKKIISDFCRKCYLSKIKKSYPCSNCGIKRNKTKSPLCSDCNLKQKTKSIINNNTKIGDKFYSCGDQNKYTFIRSHARRVISSLDLEKKCQCCGFMNGVQVCHIKPIGDFSEESLISEVNSVENLILLCPNCHWLFDHGYKSIEKIKEFYKNNRWENRTPDIHPTR